MGYYKFRKRDYAAEWSGFSDQPTFEVASEIAERVVADFLREYDEGGVDEFHVVFTRFVNGDPGAGGHPHAAARGRRG